MWQGPPELHRARRRAGRDAAQAALVGQAAVPADQLGVGLHRRGDELPAGRRPWRAVGSRSAYPSWRNYFDVIVVSASKPAFFTEDRPFLELDADGEPTTRNSEAPFQRGRVYAGGNIRAFQERAHAIGDRVLFVGDHIYGDMLRSRKSSTWRTAMVLQELEHEVTMHDRLRPELPRSIAWSGAAPPRRRAQRAAERAARAAEESGRRDATEEQEREKLEAAKRTVKEAIEKLRKELRASASQHRAARGQHRRRVQPATGARCSARATRSASSASRSRPTPASTPAGSPTSASTRPCSTSAARATACRTSGSAYAIWTL